MYNNLNRSISFNMANNHNRSVNANNSTSDDNDDDDDADESYLNDENNSDTQACEFLLTICQIVCFPFAIDANEEVLGRTFKVLKDFNLFNKIVVTCVAHAHHMPCDIPMSLIARLVLSDEDLVELLIDQLNNSSQVSCSKNHFCENAKAECNMK